MSEQRFSEEWACRSSGPVECVGLPVNSITVLDIGSSGT